MSTRSITHIHEMEVLGGHIVCSFFRHHDGYPEGHGLCLAKWLKNKILTNGITCTSLETLSFNRAGTMAVQLCNHIQEISGCEIIPTGGGDFGEEYTYDIHYTQDKEFIIKLNPHLDNEREFIVSAKNFEKRLPKIEQYFNEEEENRQ